MNKKLNEFLRETIDEYSGLCQESFYERMDSWRIDIYEKETNEVVGGLLARQLSIARNISDNPLMWNYHILPILLRCMADLYITFCWILKDKQVRSRMFIEYGLGQEKLAIEKYRESLNEESEPDPDAISFIEMREKMLNVERHSFLIPVNLGAWSELNTRKMAIEVGEKQFYDLVFTQFSSAVHSTWQHIWQMNLVPCSNPLHMGHRKPCDTDLPTDFQLFSISAKYLCKTFAKFDDVLLGEDSNNKDPYQCYNYLMDRFSEYFGSSESNDENQVD